MGRSVKAGGAGRFTLDAHGTRPLAEVVLFRDGEVVRALGRPAAAAPVAATAGTQLRMRFWVTMDFRDLPYHVGLAVPNGTVRFVPPKHQAPRGRASTSTPTGRTRPPSRRPAARRTTGASSTRASWSTRRPTRR